MLLDSALEHYRGTSKTRPCSRRSSSAALALAVSVHGTADQRARAHRARDTTYALARCHGLVGTGFHLYNVLKRPGGLAWQNVFYGAPLGAPIAILLSGRWDFIRSGCASGCAAKPARASACRPGARSPRSSAWVCWVPAREAGLLHLRGAYHNPLMYLPVTVPPAAALPDGRDRVGSRSARIAGSRGCGCG